MSVEHREGTEHLDSYEVIAWGREQIDVIDEDLAELLASRMTIAQLIAATRRAAGWPIYNNAQHTQSMDRFFDATRDHLDRDTAREIIGPLVSAEVQIKLDPNYVGDIAMYAGNEQGATSLIDDGVAELNQIDDQIAVLIGERLEVAAAIGSAKQELGAKVYNGTRETEVIKRFVEWGEAGNVPYDIAHNTIILLIREARRVQGLNGGGPNFDRGLRELTLAGAAAR